MEGKEPLHAKKLPIRSLPLFLVANASGTTSIVRQMQQGKSLEEIILAQARRYTVSVHDQTHTFAAKVLIITSLFLHRRSDGVS